MMARTIIVVLSMILIKKYWRWFAISIAWIEKEILHEKILGLK